MNTQTKTKFLLFYIFVFFLCTGSPLSCTTKDLKVLEICVCSSDESSVKKHAAGKGKVGVNTRAVHYFTNTWRVLHLVLQSPAPVGGQTAAGLQPDTGSFHWTTLVPNGWREVPKTGTAEKQ